MVVEMWMVLVFNHGAGKGKRVHGVPEPGVPGLAHSAKLAESIRLRILTILSYLEPSPKSFQNRPSPWSMTNGISELAATC
jgi:hypothetical protein